MAEIASTHAHFGSRVSWHRTGRLAIAWPIAFALTVNPASAGAVETRGVPLAVAVEAPPDDGADEAGPGDRADRQRVAKAMVYVIIGIAVAGLALIVLIILGGHRIRQRARARMGRAPDLDPLWYLRNQPRAGQGGPARAPPAEPSPPERHDPESPT